MSAEGNRARIDLFRTGELVPVHDGKINLQPERGDLSDTVTFPGFENLSCIKINLPGDSYKILAPDSQLDISQYKQKTAMVVFDGVKPVIAVVDIISAQRERHDDFLLSTIVNLHEPREEVRFQGKEYYQVLTNNICRTGGLNLAVLSMTLDKPINVPKNIVCSKKEDIYFLSLD